MSPEPARSALLPWPCLLRPCQSTIPLTRSGHSSRSRPPATGASRRAPADRSGSAPCRARPRCAECGRAPGRCGGGGRVGRGTSPRRRDRRDAGCAGRRAGCLRGGRSGQPWSRTRLARRCGTVRPRAAACAGLRSGFGEQGTGYGRHRRVSLVVDGCVLGTEQEHLPTSSVPSQAECAHFPISFWPKILSHCIDALRHDRVAGARSGWPAQA